MILSRSLYEKSVLYSEYIKNTNKELEVELHVTLELVSAIMLTINIIIIIITIILSKFTFIIIILYQYCFSSAQRLSSAWPNCSSRCKVRKLLCHSRGLCRIQGAAVPMITNYIDIYCFIYPSFCFISP